MAEISAHGQTNPGMARIISLTPALICNCAMRFSANIVCLSILSLNNFKLHEKK